MATTQLEAYNTISLVAGEDLSAKQYRFVKVNSSGQAVLCGVGEQGIGVLTNKPESGYVAEIQIGGVSKVEVDAAVTAGDRLMSSADGQAATKTGTNNSMGIALETATTAATRISIKLDQSDGIPGGGVGSFEATAITPTVRLALVTVDGTDALTLADGSIVGQQITIVCIAASNTPVGTLTLNDAYTGESTTVVFTGVGQQVSYIWTSAGWKLVEAFGAETRTSGALEPRWHTSFLSIDGTKAFTLADGTRIGQRKTIECTVATNTPVGTLTLNDAYTGEATAIVFKEVGQKVSLEWTSAGWKLLEAFGTETISAAGALEPVWPTSFLSVSGTVAYTLAAGTRLGQRKLIKCSAAAATPLGTVTLADAWSTEPTAWVFTAVGQQLELEWTSTGWKILNVVQAGAELLTAGQSANPLCLIHTFDVNGVDVIQPDAVFANQRSIWRASAATGAASTVSGLFWDEDDSADGIDANFNAIGDTAVLEWRVTRWMGISLISVDITT